MFVNRAGSYKETEFERGATKEVSSITLDFPFLCTPVSNVREPSWLKIEATKIADFKSFLERIDKKEA